MKAYVKADLLDILEPKHALKMACWEMYQNEWWKNVEGITQKVFKNFNLSTSFIVNFF